MWIDTHIDTVSAHPKQDRSFWEKAVEGHVDLPRAQEANLLAGFFTGFPSASQYITEEMLSRWVQLFNSSPNLIKRIETFRDLERLESIRINEVDDVEKRPLGVILHFEGAAGIDTELNRLHIYHDLGLRSMGITWNEINQFATGADPKNDPNRGFTKEGLDLVSAMEDLGIMIDISHLNDKSFWDLINHTNQPVFASHSNLRSICSHRRNVTEEMAQSIVDSGGSLGINLCTSFLEDKPDQADIKSIIKMLEKMISVCGINAVHCGFDMDGAPMPKGFDDIVSSKSLFEEIQKNLNLNDLEMKKIKQMNIRRVMKTIWK